MRMSASQCVSAMKYFFDMEDRRPVDPILVFPVFAELRARFPEFVRGRIAPSGWQNQTGNKFPSDGTLLDNRAAYRTPAQDCNGRRNIQGPIQSLSNTSLQQCETSSILQKCCPDCNTQACRRN